jgi:hypothetical protein
VCNDFWFDTVEERRQMRPIGNVSRVLFYSFVEVG